MAFCLLAVLGVLVMPVVSVYTAAPVYASHEDPNMGADEDGALDDDNHYNGVINALKQNWIAAMMMMTEQFVTVMMEQALIVGTFLDAKQQIEVMQIFQEEAAQAHKEYHPSYQMCAITTNVVSLAAAEMTSKKSALILDHMMEKRERLNANLASSGGIALDVTHRIKMFKDRYCDLGEANKAVFLMCNESSGLPERRTVDIDYARMVDNKYTIDLNLTDGSDTNTEYDIMSLSRNLYASTIFDFMPEQLLNETAGVGIFLETRSVHAMRSVARNSFAHVVGLRASGPNAQPYEVRPFMYGIIKELGVPEDEIADFLGENPSYFAQMEVLTRKIYQSPEFFTNLYDKPVNVQRTGVALQAIEIMQDRDRYESALRREMLISLMLELKLRDLQEEVNNLMFATTNKKPNLPEL